MSEPEWDPKADADVSQTLVAEAEEAFGTADSVAGAAAGGQKKVPECFYPSLDEWVRGWLRYNYRRWIDGNQLVWARDWWAYPEAKSRLSGLWLAWEASRNEPGAMVQWWIRWADPTMRMLTDPQGPLGAAALDEKNQSKRTEPLKCDPDPTVRVTLGADHSD